MKVILSIVVIVVIVGGGVYLYLPKSTAAASISVDQSSLADTTSGTPVISGTSKGLSYVTVQAAEPNSNPLAERLLASCGATVTSDNRWQCTLLPIGGKGVLPVGTYALWISSHAPYVQPSATPIVTTLKIISR